MPKLTFADIAEKIEVVTRKRGDLLFRVRGVDYRWTRITSRIQFVQRGHALSGDPDDLLTIGTEVEAIAELLSLLVEEAHTQALVLHDRQRGLTYQCTACGQDVAVLEQSEHALTVHSDEVIEELPLTPDQIAESARTPGSHPMVAAADTATPALGEDRTDAEIQEDIDDTCRAVDHADATDPGWRARALAELADEDVAAAAAELAEELAEEIHRNRTPLGDLSLIELYALVGHCRRAASPDHDGDTAGAREVLATVMDELHNAALAEYAGAALGDEHLPL